MGLDEHPQAGRVDELESGDLEVLRSTDPSLVAILFENLIKMMAVRVSNLRDNIH